MRVQQAAVQREREQRSEFMWDFSEHHCRDSAIVSIVIMIQRRGMAGQQRRTEWIHWKDDGLTWHLGM